MIRTLKDRVAKKTVKAIMEIETWEVADEIPNPNESAFQEEIEAYRNRHWIVRRLDDLLMLFAVPFVLLFFAFVDLLEWLGVGKALRAVFRQ